VSILKTGSICDYRLFPSKECHEQIRVLSQQAGAAVKEFGLENDLLDRIRACEYFQPIHDQLEALVDPSTFTGRCPEQVFLYLSHYY